MEAAQVPINRWVDKTTVGHLYNGILLGCKKEQKHPYVHCSVIYNHQDMEAAQVSISRWVNKITVGHLHNGILFSYKDFTLSHSMDWPGEYCAHLASRRKGNTIWFHSYVESNEQTELICMAYFMKCQFGGRGEKI